MVQVRQESCRRCLYALGEVLGAGLLREGLNMSYWAKCEWGCGRNAMPQEDAKRRRESNAYGPIGNGVVCPECERSFDDARLEQERRERLEGVMHSPPAGGPSDAATASGMYDLESGS